MPECDGLTLNIYLGMHSLTGCRSPKCYLINVYTDYLFTNWTLILTLTPWLPCTQGCTYNQVLPNNKYKISLSITHRSNWLLFHSVCINVGALILDLPNYTNHAHSHIHTSWHTHNFKTCTVISMGKCFIIYIGSFILMCP